MAYTTFGQVVPVTGALVGFPGTVSRTNADNIITARQVSPTTANPLSFGSGAVLISNATGGYWQSFADFLATASNAQYLAQYFAGIAVRNVQLQQPYSGYAQTSGTTVATTMTQATVGSTTIVVASATGIAAGQAVEGAGIAPNTTVVSIASTTVTISLATTAAIPALTNVVFTSSTTPTVGSYPVGTSGEVLERGSITVVITNGTPQANYAVYVRTVANASLAGTSVGDFEASNDVATTTPTIGVTAGSTTLTTSTGTGVVIGQQITGPGIANMATIVSGSGTSWVMSQAALYTIASGGAASFNNTVLLGSIQNPYIRFRTGAIDSNNVAEVTMSERHSA